MIRSLTVSAMDPNNYEFRPVLTEKQTVAWDTLNRPDVKEVLYGGAKGGGKSVFGCYWCFNRCLDIIKQCGIEPREHPIPVGFMGRKRGVDFSNTTLETWKRFIPSDGYVIKGKPAEIIICDRVKIITGGLDNTEVVNKFNSAEYAFYFIDQAEEVDREQIGELRATTRLIINGRKLPGKGLFTANPAPSFLKDEFILNPSPGRVYVKALPMDNPYLGASYIETLREFIGLLMTPVTLYQKILGIVGPKRSGKGTIGRVIRALAGKENVASPTLTSLTNEHGLQGLYQKTVALIGDASINSNQGDTARAVERLKSISGEDPQQINPKGKAYIEVDRLRVRFVIMANELQKLSDPTGALAGRFIYLLTTQSFYGREDVHLEKRLMAELPGIFNWALAGYFRLKERGHFIETDAGKEAKAMAEELGSPVISFVREWCVMKEGKQVRTQDLYEAYTRWCQEAGRGKMGRTRFYEEFQRAYPECGRVRVRFETDTNPVFAFSNIDLQDAWRVGYP